MKFSWIAVENVDIVDSWICVRVDIVDAFDPTSVDRFVKLLLITVERDETDCWTVERFEPLSVETYAILLFIYVNTLSFCEVNALLKVTNLSPITVENDETDWNRPIVLRVEKTEGYNEDIFEAFVEIPCLTCEKLLDTLTDKLEIEVDSEPFTVDKFHPLCVDIVLYTLDNPNAIINPTELKPVLKELTLWPIDVDVFEIVFDVFSSIWYDADESPTLRIVSCALT